MCRQTEKLPAITDILDREVDLNNFKKIVFDFSQYKRTFFPFKIVDKHSFGDDGDARCLILTKSTITKITTYLESCLLDMRLDGIYSVNEYKISIGNKSYIRIQCLNINSKQYLDTRLWMKISDNEDIPTRRGFRLEIKDLALVLDNLIEAMNFFNHWEFKVVKYVEWSINVLTSIIEEKITLSPDEEWQEKNILQSRLVPDRNAAVGWNREIEKYTAIRKNILKSVLPAEFEAKIKDYLHSSPELNLTSIL